MKNIGQHNPQPRMSIPYNLRLRNKSFSEVITPYIYNKMKNLNEGEWGTSTTSQKNNSHVPGWNIILYSNNNINKVKLMEKMIIVHHHL